MIFLLCLAQFYRGKTPFDVERLIYFDCWLQQKVENEKEGGDGESALAIGYPPLFYSVFNRIHHRAFLMLMANAMG